MSTRKHFFGLLFISILKEPMVIKTSYLLLEQQDLFMDDPFRRFIKSRKGEIIALVFIAFLSILLYSFAPSKINGGGYEIGEKVEDFSLIGVDDKTVNLYSYTEGNKGVIVIFTCNHCPFSKAYEDRIIALHKEYSPKGFPVLAINSNDSDIIPEDSFEEMKIRANEKGFPFPYLHDPTQKQAKLFGATRTPHVFLLNKEADKLKVAYIGAIDDSSHDPSTVEKTFLADALDAVLSGKEPAPKETKAIGCTIKWKK